MGQVVSLCKENFLPLKKNQKKKKARTDHLSDDDEAVSYPNRPVGVVNGEPSLGHGPILLSTEDSYTDENEGDSDEGEELVLTVDERLNLRRPATLFYRQPYISPTVHLLSLYGQGHGVELHDIFDPMPDLGLRSYISIYLKLRYVDFEEYAALLPVGFIDGLINLPVEIRHKIYDMLAMKWFDAGSGFSDYPKLIPPEGAISFARRNKKPMYERVFSGMAKFESKFGLLDYFKLREYFNIVELVKELQKHSTMERIYTVAGSGSTSDGSSSSAASPKITVAKDFMDWFFNTAVVDMKDTWYWTSDSHARANRPSMSLCLPTRITRGLMQHSREWLQNHPQYHSQIANISLELHTGRVAKYSQPRKFELDCYDFTYQLTNLKSVLLYLNTTKQELDSFFAAPLDHFFIRGLRVIDVQDKFEVKLGNFESMRNRDEETKLARKREQTEKALQVLLMPEPLFVKEHALEMKTNDESARLDSQLDFHMEASLGYMTLETNDGRLEHLAGTFLWVQ